MTTAQPWFLPLGTRMMSPGISVSSSWVASARRSALRSRLASASVAPISARSRAYAWKSPRSQAARPHSSASASVLRVSERDSPTTDRSVWNWANDCSSSDRARSRPTAPTRLTAML
jgi:hypothetical protein